MRHKLRWLAGTTAVTLLCIIGFQVFWLHTSYKEQQTRFMFNAENALVSAQVKLSLAIMLKQNNSPSGRIVAAILPDLLTEIYKKRDELPQKRSNKHHMAIKMELDDSMVAKDPELSKFIADLKEKSAQQALPGAGQEDSSLEEASYTLDTFRQLYINELKEAGIGAEVEMAVSDNHRHILETTIDTGRFEAISTKTALTPYDLSARQEGAYIQAAFPSVTWYILRRMVWLLVISSVLILLCISSFSYLTLLFFRQKRLSDIRNDFMNNMTHELKTPISSVSVALELIDDAGKRGAADSVREYIEIAQGELNRLTMLVEKVLKMAAFEKSDIKITKEAFLAASWINKITNSFKPIFETGGVVCTVNISPELLMIYGDKTHLTNVLQNLIDNAIKYNDKQLPVINIHIRELTDVVKIIVADNGKGIPEAYREKIFDKFFRVPAGNLHDVKGYGLGLSYIKAVLDLHQGTIAVESALHEGSTFIITLPKEQQL